MHRVLALIPYLLASGGVAGCTGGGIGQVSGSLFLRGCDGQGTSAATGLPSPLPAFDLGPSFFYAEPLFPVLPDTDPRGVSRLIIRLQRSSDRPENTDYFMLYLVDVATLQSRLGTPEPIIPPALDSGGVPLPTQDEPRVLAGLALNGTCQYPLVAPQLAGSVTFSSLGMNPGEVLAGQFSVTVSDPRGVRDAVPQQDQDAAGAFAGSFRFSIAAGPSANTL